MSDVEDLDDNLGLHDAVADAVGTAPSGVLPLELVEERLADPLGVLSQRTVDELDDGLGDLGR